MTILLLILINIIFPVFALIGVGAFLHRKFKFDMNTLSKINTYLLMPVVSFENIYKSKIGGDTLLHIFVFLVLQAILLILVSNGVSKLAKFDRGLSVTFSNSVVLNNSGNYGLPVSQLVFADHPLGMSIQVVITIFQNLLTYTYGLLNVVSVHQNRWASLKEFFKTPVIYGILAGLLLNAFNIEIPLFLWTPIENVANAFLCMALITLGAQSATLKLTSFTLPLSLSLIGRLLLPPLLAIVLIYFLHLDGVTAQALLIASAYPTSRNSALFALEYNNHPEYAAQAVLLTTMFSSVTVALVVYAARILFAV
ncbi:AEC family transporter [Tumebacillus sp. ITR2]|uniref:AEC family transporter n=1 Tax=Tumebacillus amylolyticus TaxID=2801339 RepID=A0ABS1JCU8_9BACL|nr:AEC family transporter [Tumebacillus amylolyticus]MBL0388086.1 AEC family transporter [Tumebacillus amylolyticus]